MLLEDILHADKKIRQLLWRDRKILDERQRAGGAFETVQRGGDSLRKPPVEFPLFAVLGNETKYSPTLAAAKFVDDLIQPIANLDERVSFVLDQQSAFDLCRYHLIVLLRCFSRQIQMPSVHQIACAGIGCQHLDDRFRRVFKPVEEQKRYSGLPGQGLNGDRYL
jgi:hypothetical protein